VWAEPAGAASLAGVLALRESGQLDAAERVVIVATGNGLKDAAAAERMEGSVRTMAPDEAALDAAVSE
jgi:threonine synthase